MITMLIFHKSFRKTIHESMTQDHITSHFPLLRSYHCRMHSLLVQKEEKPYYSFMCLVMRVMIPIASKCPFCQEHQSLTIDTLFIAPGQGGLIKENGSGACVEPEISTKELLLISSLARASVNLFVQGDMSAHHHRWVALCNTRQPVTSTRYLMCDL